MNSSFADNLNFLCGFYPSIAEVCRRVGINRQQFNKYLSGHFRPSRGNMRRICDFFGVTEAEILFDTVEFQQLLQVRKRPATLAELDGPLKHLNSIFRSSLSLDRYIGYYYRYFYSFSYPGMIVKSLLSFTSQDRYYYTKNVELIRDPSSKRVITKNKYLGVAFYLGGRIHLTEYESQQCNSISQTIFYPAYQSSIRTITGIQTGAPHRNGRRPAASKVMLEYLGTEIDPRKALRRIGLFEPTDPGIPAGVADHVQNQIIPGQFVFEVREP